jgi:hypothetical protein
MIYRVLHQHGEDERIALIGQTATCGRAVGFVVEDDAKADRYVAKLQGARLGIRLPTQLDNGPYQTK